MSDTESNTESSQETPKPSQEEIEADIVRQREELAATVTELQHRLDVKSKAQAKVSEYRSRPEVLAGVGVAVAAVVGLVVWRIVSRKDDR